MGEGARIVIFNWTKYRLVQKYIKQQNMAEFDKNPEKCVPLQIPAYSHHRFYVEYCDNIFKKAIENRGEVVYEFEEIGLQVQIIVHSKPNRHIQVNWTHATHNPQFWLYPWPVYPEGDENRQASVIEWRHNSIHQIGVFQFSHLESIQPLMKSTYLVKESWMRNLQPIIKDFTLRELMFPGAYNATGQAQSASIKELLLQGIRAFQIQIMYQADQKGEKRFQLVYDSKDKSPMSLERFCQEIVKFLDQHVMEIVLVDVTQFNASSGKFNFAEFAKIVDAFLGQRLLPPKYKLSLSQIWGAYDYERIILTLDTDIDVHPSIWPSIHHIRSPEKMINHKDKMYPFHDMIFQKKSLRFPYKNLYSIEYATSPINFKEFWKRINDLYCPERFSTGLTNVLMVQNTERTNTVENAIVVALFKCAQIKSRKKADNWYLRVEGEHEIPYWPYTDVTPKDLKEEVKQQMDDAMLAASGMMPGVTAKAMLDVGDDDDYKHTDYKHVVDDDDEGVPDAEGGLS